MTQQDQPPTAYERIVDKLHDLDLRIRVGSQQTTGQCPSHDDRQASFAVYDKGGKAKVVCYAGCDDALDILPALGMRVADLYDDKRSGGGAGQSAEWEARRVARASMDLREKALDNLLHMKDIGERLCKTIARRRPELYIWEKRELWLVAEGAELADLSEDQKGEVVK